MNYSRLADIQRDLATGSVKCTDLVDFYLSQIESQKALNLFVEVYAEEAKKQAHLVDQKIASGTAGKLAGMVLGIKDVICYQNHGLTASSQILKGFDSQFTATALARLLAEDVIIIGRQSCDEFAMGSSNENSCYGPARNPVDPNRVPGGSSGASAAAVAANMCLASLGSDTGGSVRQPASFCGVIGLKPTYGRISRWGLIAYGSSFDQIGPITRSSEDAALLLQLMAGADDRDNTSSHQAVGNYPEELTRKGPYKIAYIKEALDSPGLDPEVRSAMLNSIEQLKAAGHEVAEVNFPLLDYLVPCYYILTTAEASSNLSRFDGVHYGYRSEGAKDLNEVYTMSRSEGFGAEVKRRIILGTFVLSAGHYDAYYTRAMKVRRLIRDATRKLLADWDMLLTPTAPTTAFPIGEKQDDPIAMYLSDIYTVHANLAGCPAISIPVAHHPNGLPIGLQLMASDFAEGKLLAIAQEFTK
ncbi:MAG: Asp-tRNA(Asn)/Glu-tRNA(Gln) amidotransferase subunit GatA [Bacteroidota bacterium]